MKRVLLITLICISIFTAGSQLFTVLAGGTYSNSGQSLGSDQSYAVVLVDVNGDNALDAIIGNEMGNRVWLNNGSGFFSFQTTVGIAKSYGIAVGNLDGDQWPDVFVANSNTDNEVWLNQGTGSFTPTSQVMSPTAQSYDVALGYLDSDNSLDAFVVNNGGNEVWLNDGTAVFANTQSGMGSGFSRKVILADVNNDTFIDAYVANGTTFAQSDELWLNDGLGGFTAVTQTLDFDWNEGAALGDIDGDDDLDIVTAAWFGNSSVWFNQGGLQGGTIGEFTEDMSQTLGSGSSTDVILLDVDNDNDLDAIMSKWTPDADQIWLNDGSGQFSLSPETLDPNATYAVAAGDLDGDNDADLVFANFGGNTVWFKGGFGLPLAWFDVDAQPNPVGQNVYPWAQPGNAQLPVALSFAPPGAVDVVAEIETAVGVTTQTLPFASGQQAGNLTVANPQPVLNETVTITLDVAVNSNLRLQGGGQFNPLHLMFVDADQGDAACWLCFVDWLLQLLGFEPTFWRLHDMELVGLRDTPTWNYYQSAFADHSSEISSVVATNPSLLWQTADTLETWTPAIQAYDEGFGSTVTITQPMVDQMAALAGGVRDATNDPDLAAQIQLELDILDLDSFVGLNMDEAVTQMTERVQDKLFLPLIVNGN